MQKHQEPTFVHRNQHYHKQEESDAPDFESIISEGKDYVSDTDSEYPIESDEVRRSVESIEKITESYVRDVQTKISEAVIKLRTQSQERFNQQPKLAKKVDTRGAGDLKAQRADLVFKKMDQVKKDCYRKIEANLELLKNIDTVTEQMVKNQTNH